MNNREDLINAHNRVPKQDRKIVRLEDGTEKSFVDLKFGDVFQIILPDGSIDKYNRSNGITISWFKCTKEPYLNDDLVATVATEDVVK
jgi:hypothetical protein